MRRHFEGGGISRCGEISRKYSISFSNSPEYYAVYPREVFLHFSDSMRDAKFNGGGGQT